MPGEPLPYLFRSDWVITCILCLCTLVLVLVLILHGYDPFFVRCAVYSVPSGYSHSMDRERRIYADPGENGRDPDLGFYLIMELYSI